MKMLQQGDVKIYRIKDIPKNANKIEKDKKVLAWGEVTGHKHQLICDDKDIVSYELNGIKYVTINYDTPLKHEEHKEIILPAGTYEVRIAQEYDHFAEESREVQD